MTLPVEPLETRDTVFWLCRIAEKLSRGSTRACQCSVGAFLGFVEPLSKRANKRGTV